jgi:hypothetical protein
MEFIVTHTDEGLKTLYHDWWKRVHGVRNAWATGMLFFCMLVMVLMKSADWFLVVPTVAAACFLGLVQTIRYQATRSALEAFVRAGRPPLHYHMGPTGVTEESSLGKFELAWEQFAGLTKVGRYWLLFRGPLHNAQFIAFPDHQLPQEALILMKTQITGKP